MKKQILILMVALFAISFTTVYGQIKGSAPRPISCTTGPFNPVAGVPYDYAASLDPAAGIAYWYATTATTFMTAGARVASIEETTAGTVVAVTDANYMNNTLGAASPNTTKITWNSTGLAAATVASGADPKLFVVVEYTAPAAGCANNMKVYPIRPVYAFTVDITNVNAGVSSAYDALVEQCFDKIQSAVFTGGVIDYDFGTNIMYFEVVAANFTGSFTPTFRLGGLGATQTADIDWDVAVGGVYANNVTTAAGNGTYAGTSVTTAVKNTSTGVSIYVRVTIHNNDFEGLGPLPTPITLAVDAVNADGTIDVVNSTCIAPAAADFVDIATQNLNQRPTVTAVAPGVFIPKK